MIHGPCGPNCTTPCYKKGECEKQFPKAFASTTIQGNDFHPIYRRRSNCPPVPICDHSRTYVDNSWVVPYNPWLLLKYNCHINVEICSSIKSVKYLCKYVLKGPDRVSVEVRDEHQDEVKQFVDARWVCPPEALWKIYKFPLTKMYPSVQRLQLHLPNMHQVRYNPQESVREVVQNPLNTRTMLTEFFETNIVDPQARNYLHKEFPENYRWLLNQKDGERNKITIKALEEYTQLHQWRVKGFSLLNHVRGPESFEHLRTVDGVTYSTFREATDKMGLIEHDNSIRECLREASQFRMPYAIRTLFVTILCYCLPTNVEGLWNEFFPFMAEDYSHRISSDANFIQDCVLSDINNQLKQLGKDIRDFRGLPEMTIEVGGTIHQARALHEEISAPTFDAVIEVVDTRMPHSFFIDGPGGTGKTFLYRAILATLKSRGQFGLACASSCIVATLLHRGKTAHKTFGLPCKLQASTMWKHGKQSMEAHIIKHASVVIWDEATMTHRHAFEAVDRSLRDLMESNVPFRGKVMVFGGDFRQVLPVIPKGTKTETISACFVRSQLWRHVRVLRLTQNMRSRSDPEFASFLLRVGDGRESIVEEDMTKLPQSMCISVDEGDSVNALADAIFPNLNSHLGDTRYMVERTIVSPTNAKVDMLNEKILNKFVGEEKVY